MWLGPPCPIPGVSAIPRLCWCCPGGLGLELWKSLSPTLGDHGEQWDEAGGVSSLGGLPKSAG